MRRPQVPPHLRAASGKPSASRKASSRVNPVTNITVQNPAPAKRAARASNQERQQLAKLRNRFIADRRRGKREERLEIAKFTRRNRTRRKVLWVLGLAVLALLSLVVATLFTPILAIEKIEITGTNRLKEKSIRNSVSNLIGTPLTRVSEEDIAQRLAGFALIESFTTVSLPPHTLQIAIVERQPIGYVRVGGTNYLYDPAGVQIAPTSDTSKYPLILTDGDPRTSGQFKSAVEVLLALPMKLFPRVASIQATSKDDVRIHLRGVANQQILWGDASSSLLKSKVLAALMANTRKSARVTYDVSSPDTPTVRY